MLPFGAARNFGYGRLFCLPPTGKQEVIGIVLEKLLTFIKLHTSAVVIAALSVAVVGMGGYIIVEKNMSASAQQAAASAAAAVQPMEETQGQYVKPETPVDRSKNITLPGWGGFTIPAGTKTITQGFEFHNPEENFWYEDWVSIDGTQLEKLVVDSGESTELNHYLKLAGRTDSVAEVTDADASCFKIAQNDDGAYTVEAIQGFEGTKTITVKTDAGETVALDVACKDECYYISFGLYLEKDNELLYQSGLVAPGNYIQQMEMTRKLMPGTYDAYVVCQPYRSDKATKTNSGVVKITLTVQ